jgi:hypothetical protein
MTYYVRKLPSDVFGLEYRPTLEPTLSDARDHFMELGFFRRPPTTFSANNANLLREVLRSNREKIHCIMEIGVSRDGPGCTTDIFFEEKAPSCIYLGVDIQNKKHLDDPTKGIHTIEAPSYERDAILSELKRLWARSGRTGIDLLFIDGDHSVNTMINDWTFSEYVNEGGFVLVHDTNEHPGPTVVFDAISEELFAKERHCVYEQDWGIAVIRRLATPVGGVSTVGS